jgi:biopolymer transport protein ExbD
MSAESRVAEPELNATPLIDVLLVMLVLLIMTVPIATHAVDVNLPQRARGVPPPAVQLDILYLGDMYLEGQLVASVDELLPKFAELASREDPPLLKVVPERRAPYGLVAQVLAAARRSHVDKLTVTTIPD